MSDISGERIFWIERLRVHSPAAAGHRLQRPHGSARHGRARPGGGRAHRERGGRARLVAPGAVRRRIPGGRAASGAIPACRTAGCGACRCIGCWAGAAAAPSNSTTARSTSTTRTPAMRRRHTLREAAGPDTRINGGRQQRGNSSSATRSRQTTAPCTCLATRRCARWPANWSTPCGATSPSTGRSARTSAPTLLEPTPRARLDDSTLPT